MGDFKIIVYDVLGNIIHETNQQFNLFIKLKKWDIFHEIIKNNNKEVGKIILNR